MSDYMMEKYSCLMIGLSDPLPVHVQIPGTLMGHNVCPADQLVDGNTTHYEIVISMKLTEAMQCDTEVCRRKQTESEEETR